MIFSKEYIENLIKEENTTQPTSDNPDPAGYGFDVKDFEDNRPQNTPEYEDYQDKLNNDPYSYDNDLNEYLDGVIND